MTHTYQPTVAVIVVESTVTRVGIYCIPDSTLAVSFNLQLAGSGRAMSAKQHIALICYAINVRLLARIYRPMIRLRCSRVAFYIYNSKS